MNSKQRKIAGKIRERASLDSDAKIQKLEADRRQFAAEREADTAVLEALRKEISGKQKALEEGRSELKESHLRFQAEMEENRRILLREGNFLKEANVVREVLLLLELDEEPTEIALKIRKQFGLLIPEW